MTESLCEETCPLKKNCPKQRLLNKFRDIDSELYREIKHRPENDYNFAWSQTPPAIDAHMFAADSVYRVIREELCDGPVPLGRLKPWTLKIGIGNIVKVCGAKPEIVSKVTSMIDGVLTGTYDYDPSFFDSEVAAETMDNGKIFVFRELPHQSEGVAMRVTEEWPMYATPIQIEQTKNLSTQQFPDGE